MGEVYRAVDSVLERKVAVKLLSERHSQQEEVRARFRREALAAARLSGTPHVITVFDVGEHREQPYIVMEYLDGGSVHDRLRDDGRVPPGQALEWLGQVGVALDRAHAEGVVHRDVKPANLLLDRDSKVVVTDFGIASTTGVDTLTLPGTVLGTAGYLSPEQARGETATAASDRYALGVVAFELLTGRRPFEGDTAATEAFAHVNAPVPSAEKIYPELPDGVDEVLERALAKAPDERPETCGELVGELRDAFRGAATKTRVAAIPPVVATATATATAATAAAKASTRRMRLPEPTPNGRDGRLSHRALVIGAASFLAAGAILAAALGAAFDDDPRRAAGRTTGTTTTGTTTQPATETTTEPPPTTVADDGFALNDQGFALMQQGNYTAARPLLERSVRALSGSGELYEGYASYNLAFTRFALGVCDGVLTLLDRSEAVQGEREAINELYRDAYYTCVGGGGDGDDD
jgi:eukaryotic-like serine/threonine-protein kinase